ncbi:MAG: amidohydrolase, partial [Chitinophagaceae bacterium]
MRVPFLIGCCLAALSSFSQRQEADLLIYNARVYTVDSSFSIKEAMVIGKEKIMATGTKADLEKQYSAKKTLDASGKFIYPGFIDAHAHFVGYGLGLQQVDLTGTGSWKDILQKLVAFEKTLPADQWLIGRGWDQNDWDVKDFPTNERLNELFPARPVLLSRIDGHAAIANATALQKAGIRETRSLTGGEIETKNGKLTGILIDNAIDLVSQKIPATSREQFRKAVLDAQQNCFAQGLTTIDDCGLGFQAVEGIKWLQEKGELKMRLYVMLSDEKSNFDYLDKTGIIKTDRLTVRGFKVYGDGALGSRGACLLEPYSDKPGAHGFLLSRPEHFDSVARWIAQRPFQMCTHAIGD